MLLPRSHSKINKMFKIDYKIITNQLEELECISDEEIRYNFLLGNVSLISSEASIEMEWEWIPLLDFSICMRMIVSRLKEKVCETEFFEFTENAEKLEFSKQGKQLKILTTFTSKVIDTKFADFEKAIYDFHLSINEYIQTNTTTELSCILQNYLIFKS